MYGLERNDKFDFDLELDLKKNPKKKEELLSKTKTQIKTLSAEIKANSSSGNIDNLGILLNGYDSLEKVLTKIK